MASRISKTEWKVLGVIAGMIDALQLVLDIFAVGVVINRIVDVIIGFSLPLYFQIRGVSMANPKRLTAFFATLVGEMIPVVDAFPLWTLDIYVTYLTTKGETALAEKAPEIMGNIMKNQQIPPRLQTPPSLAPQPMNQNGVRMPNPRQSRRRYESQQDGTSEPVENEA